jgi:phasin family protein
MAQPDSKLTPATTGTEMAMSGFVASSKNMQALISELGEISQQSFEHGIQTFEKLRHARNIDQVFAIQTDFLKEAVEHVAQHTRRLGEIMSSGPMEMMKTCQEAMLRSGNTAVH